MYTIPPDTVPRRGPGEHLLPLLAILFASLLAACGGSTPVKPDQPAETGRVMGFMASVDYFDREGEMLPPAERPKEVTILFLPVEGGVLGRIDRHTVRFRARVEEGGVLNVDLSGIDRMMRTVLAYLPLKARTGGLRSEPERMQLARLVTLALEGESAPYRVHAARLADAIAGDRIVLMYADRPGRVFGTLEVEEHRYFYDVEFPSAGFHLLRVSEIEGGYLVRYEPSDVLLRMRVMVAPEVPGTKGAVAGDS